MWLAFPEFEMLYRFSYSEKIESDFKNLQSFEHPSLLPSILKLDVLEPLRLQVH